MASFRTWPDGEVLMLFDMTGSMATTVQARSLGCFTVSQFPSFLVSSTCIVAISNSRILHRHSGSLFVFSQNL
jgi:hypothetical protein